LAHPHASLDELKAELVVVATVLEDDGADEDDEETALLLLLLEDLLTLDVEVVLLIG